MRRSLTPLPPRDPRHRQGTQSIARDSEHTRHDDTGRRHRDERADERDGDGGRASDRRRRQPDNHERDDEEVRADMDDGPFNGMDSDTKLPLPVALISFGYKHKPLELIEDMVGNGT